MLQTLDFLKFPEELLFETNQFLTELYNVEISPNFAKSENSQEIFPVGSVFSIVIYSKLDSDLYPLKTFFWKFFMTCSFYRLVGSR